MKKVLIITYYWPPTGGSGVQRWLKFSKYLPEYGWEPIIYTPSNPEASMKDDSLEKDIAQGAVIIKRPIWEPYSFYRRLSGGSKASGNTSVNPINNAGKRSFLKSFSLWVRANFFVPDPRVFWVRPSVKFLKKYLSEHPVDAIVSTGPPHSIHLIAREVSKATGIKWVADFRDPWTKIFYFKHLPICHLVSKYHHKLELSVLKEANAIVTVTEKIKKEFEEMIQVNGGNTPVYKISNGFDPDDFTETTPELESSFCLTHTGLLAAEGNPTKLWEVLRDISNSDLEFKKNLKLRLIGKTDSAVLDSIQDAGLMGNVENMGYLPHSEITSWQQKARVLLLPLRNEPEAGGILTGKFFEYLAALRPIIAFGPKDGELASGLKETSSGEIFEWEDEVSLKKSIENHYKLYLEPSLNPINPPKNSLINKYSRKELTAKMSEIL